MRWLGRKTSSPGARKRLRLRAKKKWDTIHPTQNLKERKLALLRPSEAVRVSRANCAILGIVPTYLLHGWSSY